MAAVNHHKPILTAETKNEISLDAITLDAQAGVNEIVEARDKRCQFVLYTQVLALQKARRLDQDAQGVSENAEVDVAMLQYELKRVADGALYTIGIVKSGDSESAADAIFDALDRIPNKVAEDIQNPANALVGAPVLAKGQAALDLSPGVPLNEDRCAWLPKTVPYSNTLRGACEYAVTQSEKMPNFICHEETSRFVGRRRVPTDLVTATLRYVDGEESYSDLKRNGRTVSGAMWNTMGLWSSGQLEGNLEAIFHAENRAVFTFVGQNKLGTHTAIVFAYQIARQYEPLWELRSADRIAAPPYEGELWVDAKSGQVLHFSSAAKELPAWFAISQAEILIDYENVAFPDGRRFVLPTKSTVTTHYRQEESKRNVVEFRGFREFRATARLVLDVPKAIPGAASLIVKTPDELAAEREENESIYDIAREQAIEEDAAEIEANQQQELKVATGEAFWKLAQLAKQREKLLARAKTVHPESSYEIVTGPNGTATFRVNVTLVPVSVVVWDNKGHAVGNLEKENFQILDNRKPQEIVSFSVEKGSGVRGPAEISAASQQGDQTISNSVAYVFDDLHTTSVDLMKARAAAERHLNQLGREDRMAVFTTSGDVQLDFTADRGQLQAALKKLNSHSSASLSDCPQISYYVADLIVNGADSAALEMATEDASDCMFGSAKGMGMGAQGGSSVSGQFQAAEREKARQIVMAKAFEVANMGKVDSDRALSMLHQVLSRTEAMPGRRSVVLLSPGFPTISRDQQRGAMYLIERAMKSGVVFSGLDVRGLAGQDLTTQRIHSTPGTGTILGSNEGFAAGGLMADLAYGTGGIYFHNNNDLDEGLRKAADRPQYVYLLGFSPQRLDDKFHKLKVTVKGSSKLTVHARTGYYALKPVASRQGTAKPASKSSSHGPLAVF